jgi:hypothetical protein
VPIPALSATTIERQSDPIKSRIEGADKAAALRIRYRNLTGRTAPKGVGTALLQRSVRWFEQCHDVGLSPERAREILEADLSKYVRRSPKVPKTAIIVKEWRGKTYEVVPGLNGTFRCGGQTYSSLSRLAFHITGTKRSGPRFFGLLERP